LGVIYRDEGDKKMKALIRSRAFITSFIISYYSYFLITIRISNISRPGIGVGDQEFGFPFTYYEWTCFGGGYVYSGLFGNILFAALIGTILGIFCAYVWKTLASEDFRRKWHL
jgi:hypothetical protein